MSEAEDTTKPAGRPRRSASLPSTATAAAAKNRLRRVGRPDTARIQRAPERVEAEREDPRAAAVPGRQTRRRRNDDAFAIPKSIIPEGMSYEWKRESVYGQKDNGHQVNLRENGWVNVQAERHPELMPNGASGAIQKDGMVLMERPAYLTMEAREEDYAIAKEQVHGKERSLGATPAGTFTRDHPSVHRTNTLNKSYGPGFIPD